MGDVPQEKKDESEWRSLFNELDIDGNGQLSRDEVQTVMCCCKQNPTDKELDEMMVALDKNSDDKIDIDEFCSYMQQMADPEETMKDALTMFEEDGKLTREKLKEILGTEDEAIVEEILSVADVNGDGIIDKEEFISFLQNSSSQSQ